jgi:hypothetical protein
MRHASCQLWAWLIFDVRQGRARVRIFVRQSEERAYSVQGIPTYNLDANASKEDTRGFLGFVLEFDRPQGKGAKRSLKPPGDATVPRKKIVMRGLVPRKRRCQWTSRATSHFISSVIARQKKTRPNKALEPTPTAVTPRAMEMESELKQWIPEWSEARVVPAVGVAHL